MSYVKGEDRQQILLFADSIDSYVENDNPVRGIDAFVNSLDMDQLGFSRASISNIGRPPYNPADLLKLYIYGYLNGIRSSRKLERESGRNIELMWLMHNLKPDFKTIADFRRDNKEPIRNVFLQFNALCKDWELFGGTLIAVDGTKMRANNSRRNNFSPKKIKRQIEYIDQQINEYLKAMDEVDESEQDLKVPTAQEMQDRIAELQSRKQGYEVMSEQLTRDGATEISTTDSDARRMIANNNGTDVSTYKLPLMPKIT